MQYLPDAALAHVAAYFRVLGDPMRLQILQWLDGPERTVGELAQLCGCSAANISRHLALLTRHALVQREVRGHRTHYRLADAPLDRLLDRVCAHWAGRGTRGFAALGAKRQ
ncbi:MAG: metalloregulator ArsR/SmtB family transcription factor [Simplicispira sp.]|nr:metalloregulator ArsR/SmtB family transcription factor [Simplicispira sp.]